MSDPLLVGNLCFFDADGHNHYRVHLPSRILAEADGVTVIDCDLYHRGVAWVADEADVLVLHGLNPEWYPLIQRRRSRGQIAVLEASDHYFDIQPWSSYSSGWLDRSLQDLFWQTAAAADAVQTSTDALARVWGRHARRVLVFPNPVGDIPPLAPVPARPLTIGWAGSGTHLADWAAAAPAVERWVAAHPTARLAILSDERAAGLIRLPPERYRFHRPGSLAAYSTFLATLDIGFVPLLPGPFNSGRTDLKFLDYAAAGVAGVYPRSGPYSGSVQDGRTGLLYDTPLDLVQAIGRLAGDAGLRDAIRTAAHREACRRRAEDRRTERLDAYRGLLGRAGKAPALPVELQELGRTAGRYIRLEPGEPERALAAAIGGPASEEVAARLANIVRSNPGYRAADRQLSRVLNDLGRHGDALRAAECAAAGAGESPGIQIEIGRAYLGLGRRDEARYHLERAVVANPRHPVAWQLLRELAPDAEEIGRVSRLWSRNAPSQYIVALGGLATLPPADAAAALADLAARFVPTLHPEERPYAAAAFGQAAVALDGQVPPETAEPALAALARSFPESALLADLHGECQFRLGHVAEADDAFARAARLNRIAVTARLESETSPPRVWRWQVAEYARRSASAAEQDDRGENPT